MSIGLLFHYFESKEKLYEELIRIGIAGPMGIMEPNGLEPLEFFQGAADKIFGFIKKDSFTAKMFVLMNQAYYNEAAPSGIKEMLNRFDIYTPTTVLIKKGQDNGTIRQGDSYALAITFWCAIQGIAEQIAQRPELPCPDSEWIIDMIRGNKE